MLSVRLLLICVAVAVAVPLPSKPKHYVPKIPTTAAPTTTTAAPTTTTPAPTTTAAPATTTAPPPLKPDFGFLIRSKQTQTGSSSGGASVSSTGSTQGSASSSVVVTGPGFVLKKAAAGNGGASGSGVSSGTGAFGQKAETNTVVGSSGTRRAQVQTGTKGKGWSVGKAGSVQKTGANAEFQGVQAITFNQPKGINFLKIQVNKKAGASSSSGHEGTTKGLGVFSIVNVGGTELKRANPAPVPTDPNDSLSSDSKLKQVGKTTGTSSLSATGSTQGSGGVKIGLWTPIVNAKKDFAGNSGVSGNGKSSGNGFFVQGVKANTELISTKEGLKVKTGTAGAGTTSGSAGFVEKAGANGRATDVAIITFADGSKEVRLVNNKKATATSGNGHAGSSSGNGMLNVSNQGETEVKLNRIDFKAGLDSLAKILAPAPTTTPAPTPSPKYHKYSKITTPSPTPSPKYHKYSKVTTPPPTPSPKYHKYSKITTPGPTPSPRPKFPKFYKGKGKILG